MFIGTVVTIMVAGFTSFASECERLPDTVLRLHVLAESNSEEDQDFKYKVRDYILENFTQPLSESETLEEANQTATELLVEIESSVQAYTNRDDIKAEITEMYFPTRVYDTGTLPAGTYTALRITIGEGLGENWWCVMFPLLCLPAVTENQSEPQAKQVLPAVSLPEKVTESPKVKFALFEFFSGFFRG
jgi:stage II sporulation protein R